MSIDKNTAKAFVLVQGHAFYAAHRMQKECVDMGTLLTCIMTGEQTINDAEVDKEITHLKKVLKDYPGVETLRLMIVVAGYWYEGRAANAAFFFTPCSYRRAPLASHLIRL